MNEFKDKLIRKPWGSEYQLFVNEEVSIWHLTIRPGQCTSLHAHPKKKTGLLVLDGAAEVSFLNNTVKLLPVEKIMIRHGVFHRTTNNLSMNLRLLEIETPVDKRDIIRLKDEYGRSGQKFGIGQTYETMESVTLEPNKPLYIGSCQILPTKINNIEELNDLTHNHNYMILDGGIVTDFCSVVAPGDIANKKDLLNLAQQFWLVPTYMLDISHV